MIEMTQRRRGDQNDIPYTTWSDQVSVINMCLSNSYEKIKFCKTCRIYRPPRTTHCKVCERCVSQFDHHCTLLGTCIGRNNYRAFFLFLLSGTMLALSMIVFSFRLYLHFNSAESEMTKATWFIVIAIFLINLINFSVDQLLLVRRHDSGIVLLPLLLNVDLSDNQRAHEAHLCLRSKPPQKTPSDQLLEHGCKE